MVHKTSNEGIVDDGMFCTCYFRTLIGELQKHCALYILQFRLNKLEYFVTWLTNLLTCSILFWKFLPPTWKNLYYYMKRPSFWEKLMFFVIDVIQNDFIANPHIHKTLLEQHTYSLLQSSMELTITNQNEIIKTIILAFSPPALNPPMFFRLNVFIWSLHV